MSGDERALNRLVSEWVLVVRNSKTNIWGGTKGKYSRREILKVRAIYHIEKWKLDPCELWQLTATMNGRWWWWHENYRHGQPGWHDATIIAMLYNTSLTTLPNTIFYAGHRFDPLTLFQKTLNQELKANEKRHCAHSPALDEAVWHSQ